MRINGYNLGLEPAKVAGIMIRSRVEHDTFAQLWTDTEREMPIILAKPFRRVTSDIDRKDSRCIVEVLQSRLANDAETAAGRKLVDLVLRAESTSELAEAHIRQFIEPNMTPVDEAQAILRGCERIMRRPDILTRPL